MKKILFLCVLSLTFHAGLYATGPNPNVNEMALAALPDSHVITITPYHDTDNHDHPIIHLPKGPIEPLSCTKIIGGIAFVSVFASLAAYVHLF